MRALSKTLAVGALAAISSFAVEHATAIPSAATARPGQPAPSFSAPDIAGKTVGLGDYAGEIVVLEWTNDGCPFVGKHYNSGNMQALQHKYMGTGVVWLTIASSAPGEQGYVTPAVSRSALSLLFSLLLPEITADIVDLGRRNPRFCPEHFAIIAGCSWLFFPLLLAQLSDRAANERGRSRPRNISVAARRT